MPWITIGLMVCYPLGRVMQLCKLEPDYIGRCVSDIGVIPFVAFIVYRYVIRGKRYGYLSRWVISTSCVTVVAIGSEVLQLPVGSSAGGASVSRGDWLEIGCYSVSYVVVLYLAHHEHRQLISAEVAWDKKEQERRLRKERARRRKAGERERRRKKPRRGR